MSPHDDSRMRCDRCGPLCCRHLCEHLQEHCRPLLVSMVELTQRVKDWVETAENLTNKWCAHFFLGLGKWAHFSMHGRCQMARSLSQSALGRQRFRVFCRQRCLRPHGDVDPSKACQARGCPAIVSHPTSHNLS